VFCAYNENVKRWILKCHHKMIYRRNKKKRRGKKKEEWMKYDGV
jgi:hypothetical protein